MKKEKIVYRLGVITLMVILGSCGGGSKVEKETGDSTHHQEAANTVELTEAQFRTAGIRFGKLAPREISGAIRVNGLLDVPPQQLVSVSVPMGGFIKHTSLLQGMHVKKGQVLAILEHMDYIQLQQDYLDVKSQLEYAKVEYERQQALAAENVNALKILQQSKAAWQSLQVKYTALRRKLALLNVDMPALEKGDIQSTVPIYAPISGYVTQVNVNLGQFVNPADILFRIVDTEHLHAELTVFEKDVPRLKIGQKVRFTLANEGEERTASVHLIGREISPERTVRVHCHLDREDLDLLPGTYLQALIETGHASVPALPEEAVVSYEDRNYIFVKGADERHFTMVEVQKGNNGMGYTEVRMPEGMRADTPVVVKGAYDLLAKMKNSGEEGHGH